MWMAFPLTESITPLASFRWRGIKAPIILSTLASSTSSPVVVSLPGGYISRRHPESPADMLWPSIAFISSSLSLGATLVSIPITATGCFLGYQRGDFKGNGVCLKHLEQPRMVWDRRRLVTTHHVDDHAAINSMDCSVVGAMLTPQICRQRRWSHLGEPSRRINGLPMDNEVGMAVHIDEAWHDMQASWRSDDGVPLLGDRFGLWIGSCPRRSIRPFASRGSRPIEARAHRRS